MSTLKPLDDQIAGHTEEDGGSENIPPFLKSDDGYVFKPVSSARGIKELEFYKSLDSYDKTLVEFIPRYSKTEIVNKMSYIGIEDLTYGYKQEYVNVADIKMGTRTYGNEASAEKRKNEEEKSSKTTTKSLGIRFCGAKIVDPTTCEKEKLSKVWGKQLKTDLIFEQGIKKFFWNQSRDKQHNIEIVNAFILKLEKLLNYFENSNKEFAFYSSSLLFVYGPLDKDIEINNNNGGTSTTITKIGEFNSITYGISLKMIDFAHVDKIEPPQLKDDSYIFGLKNLISLLKQL